jgi:F420-dependent oxidoreductase-like protein
MLSPQSCTVEELRTVWRIADDAGFDHLWAFDHFNPIVTGLDGDVYEGMTLLAAMAQATSRVRIGLMVTGNTYRHPAVLAKMATTIDHLSGGRLEFGLGASGVEVEHAMRGIPFAPPGERVRRLGEALTVCRKLWTEERSSFAGRYYTLTDAVSNPKPVQRPHPPIWVGGAGEKVTLRIVAEHADVWNAVGSPEIVRKGSVLDRHCADIGRDPSTIRRSVLARFDPADPSALVDELHTYVDAGFADNVINLPLEGDFVKATEVAAERVLPEFARRAP